MNFKNNFKLSPQEQKRQEMMNRFLVLLPRYLILYFVTFLVIRLIGDKHEWIRAGLTMVWGVVTLSTFLYVILKPWPKIHRIGIGVLWFSAGTLVIGFVVWLISVIVRIINIVPAIFHWNWHINPLFHNIHGFVFSLPSLVCAAAFFFIASAWDYERKCPMSHDDECARLFE
jgi:hypothetical protein